MNLQTIQCLCTVNQDQDKQCSVGNIQVENIHNNVKANEHQPISNKIYHRTQFKL